MRYQPSFEPTSRVETLMTHRRVLITLGVIAGSLVGAVVAYYLPLLWWYFANGLSDTGGGPHGVDPVVWLAPFGAIAGAGIGGLSVASRTESLARERAAAADVWATRSPIERKYSEEDHREPEAPDEV